MENVMAVKSWIWSSVRWCQYRPKSLNYCKHTHTHLFNGPLSGTTQVVRYQKVKPIWILLKQETVSGSGISWVICKSAPRSRQITSPAPHHSVFYRPDALPAAQPTRSKHWEQTTQLVQTWWKITSDKFAVGEWPWRSLSVIKNRENYEAI